MSTTTANTSGVFNLKYSENQKAYVASQSMMHVCIFFFFLSYCFLETTPHLHASYKDQIPILALICFIGFMRSPLAWIGVNRENNTLIYISLFFELITNGLCIYDICKFSNAVGIFDAFHVLFSLSNLLYVILLCMGESE